MLENFSRCEIYLVENSAQESQARERRNAERRAREFQRQDRAPGRSPPYHMDPHNPDTCCAWRASVAARRRAAAPPMRGEV